MTTDAPPPAPPPPASPPTAVPRPPRPARGYGGDALLALALAGLFVYLGLPLLTWLAHGRTGNPFGYVWSDGPNAGRPVDYFDVQFGAAWRDVGLIATAVALLAEAALLLVATARPTQAVPALRAAVAVAVLGVLANALAAAMQVRAGFNGPLYALVGGVVCLFTAVAAWQRAQDARPA